MITAILIDDERKSLSILENKLNKFFPIIEIVSSVQDPLLGLELIKEKEPDLVFLDISMPMMSGFDLLSKIEEPTFELIFVTAYDDYAIDAIEHCAIAYLVKPVDNQKLTKAVNTAIVNVEKKNALSRNKQLLTNLNPNRSANHRLVIPVQDGLEFVNAKDIVVLEGDSGYTKIHFLNKETILSSYRIGHFCKILSEQDFFQIHKSYIINCKFLKKFFNDGTVLLENDQKYPVSRYRKNDFLEFIK